jgi:hypothetical protein
LFVEDSLLILKRVGTEDNPFILINEEKIPNLDVVNYLDEYEKVNRNTKNTTVTKIYSGQEIYVSTIKPIDIGIKYKN